MIQRLLRFSFVFFFVVAVAYLIHVFVLTIVFSETNLTLINFSYKFNIGITYIFTGSALLAGKKLKDQLGFVFLVTGFVKIGLFLFLVDSLDLELNRSNFFDFFGPYITCLCIEIFYIIQLLKNSNERIVS